MNAYETLAGCYDSLTYDIPYSGILSFWETVLRRFHAQPETVLDLACGTGSLSVLLAQKGYRVIGSDISAEMLTVAYEKAMELEENRPFFICQPMQKLRLAEPVDAVICCLDSLNYVTRPADCRETMRRVYHSLTPGGVYSFDINTPYTLEGLDAQIVLDEDEGTYRVWRPEFDRRRRLCHYGMDIFVRDESGWQRSQEEHLEYAYEPEELQQWLQEAGFREIRTFGDRKLRSPKPDEQRIYFAAKKESI
ncbi:MAG: methyltransferase domain-containing protein [Clostridia bacterium]|nr:methyltransferase domain-containing protein [Clostridia bacterium]